MIDPQAAPEEPDEAEESDCRRQALKYLSRREYSARELSRKLRKKGHPALVCERVISHLVDRQLLSDRRYAEAYVYARMNKGFGPVRIRHALEEAGVEKDIIDDVMTREEFDWNEQLKCVLSRKFGDSRPGSYKEWVKRARYLNNKGFSSEQIQSVLEFNN